MARGKRKFVVEITETREITVEEISAALNRFAAHLKRGTASIETGSLYDRQGHQIGHYKWLDQFALPGRPADQPAKAEVHVECPEHGHQLALAVPGLTGAEPVCTECI